MREYGSVHTRFWIHPTLCRLSNEVKLLALYLLTGPHTNMLGCFRLPPGYVAEDLGWSSETVTQGLKELEKAEFITVDRHNNWVLIHRFLDWNPIENPNQAINLSRLFEQIPDGSLFCKKLIEILLLRHYKHLSEPFKNRLVTLQQQFLNQDQDKEQDQEKDQDQEQEKDQEREKNCGAELRERSPAPKEVAPHLLGIEKSSMLVMHPPSAELIAITHDAMTEAAVLTVPLVGGAEYAITHRQVCEWQALYPAVDVMQSLRHLRAWNLTNVKRRKTKAGILRHITGWLANNESRASPGSAIQHGAVSLSLYEQNTAVSRLWLEKSH